MKYITSLEMANRIGKTKRWVNDCCAKGLVKGAYKDGNRWMIPDDTKWEVGSDNVPPLPIGVSNFELAISDYYYVDKTLLIKDLIDYRPQVSLFLRPRRFGKTLNMDMLRTFFEYADISKDELFAGTKIWSAGSKYKNEQGKYPVIYFTFKDAKFNSWDETFINIKDLIQQEYKRHFEFLSKASLEEVDKKFLGNVMSGKLEEALWSSTLGRLSELLHIAIGRPVIILIDEYDTPIQQGHMKGFYDEMIGFMRNFLSGGLKDNKHLSMAFLTGILRVAKESIFSGLNNLNTNSVLERRYSEYFGFTENEVRKLLKDYKCDDKLEDIKKWYDGYNFGGIEIYNPWSVLNYVNNDCLPQAYWQSTGSNEIIGEVLDAGAESLTDEIKSLLLSQSQKVYVDTAVIYPEVRRSPSSVYSFLLMGGYLTVESAENLFDGNSMCKLKIPNKEIQVVFEKEVLTRRNSIGSEEIAAKFKSALMANDSTKLQLLLESFLKETISFHDAAAEGFYHGLLLGFTAIFNDYYEITSNREAGAGRYDIRLKSKDVTNPNFVIEVKSITQKIKAENAAQILKEEALEALEQINDKDYVHGLTGEIRKIGIAFWKKQCEIATE